MPLSGQKGETPLLLVARNGHEEVMQNLLNAGADTEAQDQVRLLGTLVGTDKPGIGRRLCSSKSHGSTRLLDHVS